MTVLLTGFINVITKMFAGLKINKKDMQTDFFLSNWHSPHERKCEKRNNKSDPLRQSAAQSPPPCGRLFFDRSWLEFHSLCKCSVMSDLSPTSCIQLLEKVLFF